MKQILVILCLAFITSQLSAQAKFGLKAGLNYSKYKFELSDYFEAQGATKPVGKFSSIPGFQGGLIIIAPFSENIGLRTELLLSFRNVEYNEYTSETNPVNFQQIETGEIVQDKSSYLDIPLNIYYSLPVGANAVQLYMGFTMGIGLFGTYTYAGWSKESNIISGTSTTNAYEGEDDVAFGYIPYNEAERAKNTIYKNPIDLSINLGASFLLSEHFLISLQYSKGLSNTVPFQEDYVSYNRKDENRLEYRSTAFSLAYLF